MTASAATKHSIPVLVLRHHDDLVEDKVYLIYPERLEVGMIRAKFIGSRFNVQVNERRRNGNFRVYQTFRELAVLIMLIPNSTVDGACGTPVADPDPPHDGRSVHGRRSIPGWFYAWNRC